MTQKQGIALIGVALLYVIVYFLNDRLLFPLYIDEDHYWPTTQRFSLEPIPSRQLLYTYTELNTPLPFILGGWIIRLFGDNIQYLRLLNFLLSFGVVGLFIWINPAALTRAGLALVGLFLFPFFYHCSIHFYTDMVAVFFVVSGVVAYLKQHHWLAALFFALSICARQYMVAFPAAIVCYEIYLFLVENRSLTSDTLKKAFGRLFPYGVSCLTIIAWALFWGGLAPPAEMARQFYDNGPTGAFRYNTGFLLYATACLGAYFVLPELLLFQRGSVYRQLVRRRPWLVAGVGLGLGVAIWLFPAIQTRNGYFAVPYLGFLDRTLVLAGVGFTFKHVIFWLLAWVCALRFLAVRFNFSTLLAVINLLLLGKTQIAWDKYLLGLVAVLWLLKIVEEPSGKDSERTVSHPADQTGMLPN